MKDFEFYKTIRSSNKKEKLIKAFSKLHNFYNKIPDTKGCMENINAEGGACGAWCCKIQTPQLLYSEFLLLWNFVSKNWDDDEVCDLFERCMSNAVNPLPSKGCVFFDNDTCMCKVHNVRPYNCRIYGITPDEEFNPRYERLKKEYDRIVGAVIRPQCSLVSTEDDSEITKEQIDEWWEKLVEIERSIGIPKDMVSDSIGGSYRTPHDHVLLYNMPENLLNALSGIKQYDDEFDKKRAIKELVQVIRNVFKKS
jgi:Fe-S-cluster containining protein